LGNAQRELGDSQAARASFAEAVEHCRTLAEARPDAFRDLLAHALVNLGTAQADLDNLEAARASYAEARDHYRALADARPDAYRHLLANTLNNLSRSAEVS